MKCFGKYSHYYDLLYQDKDYAGEAEYVHNLICKYRPNSKTILDLGCGTGRHAKHLANRGYKIHGVDLSEEMLVEANKIAHEEELTFSKGDIRTIRLDKAFDVIVSLFHVISYQTTNDALLKTLATAYKHLEMNGLFIFDCWYGPAVLTDRPAVRVKCSENDDLKITRIAEPIMHPNENIVDVHLHAFIRDKEKGTIDEIKEKHSMRYLFKPEVDLLLNNIGFTLEGSFEFMTNKELGYTTWNACFVARK